MRPMKSLASLRKRAQAPPASQPPAWRRFAAAAKPHSKPTKAKSGDCRPRQSAAESQGKPAVARQYRLQAARLKSAGGQTQSGGTVEWRRSLRVTDVTILARSVARQ